MRVELSKICILLRCTECPGYKTEATKCSTLFIEFNKEFWENTRIKTLLSKRYKYEYILEALINSELTGDVIFWNQF